MYPRINLIKECFIKKKFKKVLAQTGSILKETDIVRYQDVYGRVK